ncbi:MAG: helix-turn-helix domain-containing protein [Candidatus Ornithomonoglobus sp.]
MLVHSNEKIQDIAMYTGYTDLYSFSKAFKKYYKTSPSEFRQNHIY